MIQASMRFVEKEPCQCSMSVEPYEADIRLLHGRDFLSRCHLGFCQDARVCFPQGESYLTPLVFKGKCRVWNLFEVGHSCSFGAQSQWSHGLGIRVDQCPAA